MKTVAPNEKKSTRCAPDDLGGARRYLKIAVKQVEDKHAANAHENLRESGESTEINAKENGLQRTGEQISETNTVKANITSCLGSRINTCSFSASCSGGNSIAIEGFFSIELYKIISMSFTQGRRTS